MFEMLRSALAGLRESLSSVEQEHVSGDDAAALVELFTEAERVAAAGRTLAARRVEETKVWQRQGHRSAAHWVASKLGVPLGHAIGVLETAGNLKELPETRKAFYSGRLSEVQAREISGAACANPKAERALLDSARTRTVGALRDECRRVRAAAIPDEVARHEAIRIGRRLRHWSDSDGAVRLDARLTPDAGAFVIAAIEARQDRIFADARAAGLRESAEACAADALVELARCGGAGERSSGPQAMVHVLVDHEVLTRYRRARAGQTCEIPGVGPIAAATARALAGDSILKAIVLKGSDIHSVVHLGRTIPARVRTALEVRDPVCVVPDCDARKGLEIDHYRVPYVDCGETRLDNLARLCRWHHYLKTHLGYRLTGGPGAWTWETPADLEGSRDRARPPPGS